MLDAELYDQIAAGSSFEDVESWIEALDVSDRQKSVLWMLALAEQPRWRRREIFASIEHLVAA